MPRHDPYRVLGVTRTAEDGEITAAFRALVRALHPDTRREPADPARLAEVLAAYRLLRDPRRRAAYDRRHSPAAPRDPGATPIPVRVRTGHSPRQPDIRVSPVRRHFG
ncbi:DnaJ domain-containing protein [Amycolatopsis regifaucium]|uniref:J domain-containing protein n=1 Tax=Amycolatopsis regifaucium TaxID=546365 RepID=A0A154M603_9PSEU|nr:DnaJ domain-containing protein [Amycolatopsis regifaucium]KZB79289.1 hypothetical protein AVL48_16990 [Amycolatopsis regifaucium]OKA07471.1 hypothetical protein ATP06_0216675 [Amycolatopsis regifaucium]SFH10772.1 DnaJ domain-containing protein [Amycolatopsis regifaucium]